MSYTFALSSPDKASSLRSPSNSRSNSITSTSSTSSSIYSRSSFSSNSSITPITPITPKLSPGSKTKAKSSFFHHASAKQQPPTIPSIVDTKKEQREAREARNRAIRLREQLLREPLLEDDSSTPAERRAARDSGDKWKMHYEMLAGTTEMMAATKTLRR